ncbi:MAG: peroxiredoxin [Myxococcota bacterium]|jgi:peroxiredoxin
MTPLMLLSAAFAAPPTVSVGQHALSFSLPAINEEVTEGLINSTQLALSDFIGVSPDLPQRAVIIYFFNRSDGGMTLPDLNEIQKRYDGKGVQVIAISTDAGPIGGLSTWIEEQQLTFPVLRDSHQIVSSRYGVEQLPFALVVDGGGYIFAMGRPMGTDFHESIEAELRPLLE